MKNEKIKIKELELEIEHLLRMLKNSEASRWPVLDYKISADTPHMPSVTIMRDKLSRHCVAFDALLSFASGILGKDENKITAQDLFMFNKARFHAHEDYIRNASFPVDFYLAKIKELLEENKE